MNEREENCEENKIYLNEPKIEYLKRNAEETEGNQINLRSRKKTHSI